MAFVRIFNRRYSMWDPQVLIHERVKVPGKCHMRIGMRGYLYAATRAMAEFMSLAKAWEKAHAKPRLHPPPEMETGVISCE